MATERQVEANRRNALLSRGPRDSSQSRLNATRHGILSQEVLISSGAGKEDPEALRVLSDALWAQAAPVGMLEELLVDQLVAMLWRWRRVLRYEAAAAGLQSERVTEGYETEGAERAAATGSYLTRKKWERTESIAARVEAAARDLEALAEEEPLSGSGELWRRVLAVAATRFKTPVRSLLKLKMPWTALAACGQEQVEMVIDATCERAGISEEQFWSSVRTQAKTEYTEAAAILGLRRAELAWQRQIKVLPEQTSLDSVQRYEAHLSRQFYRALHELQRLQAARQGLTGVAPLAIDIEGGDS
ncbi:MAG: hypothetical protein ACR2PL_26915 [Dehalococcoidia bacterium]